MRNVSNVLSHLIVIDLFLVNESGYLITCQKKNIFISFLKKVFLDYEFSHMKKNVYVLEKKYKNRNSEKKEHAPNL